MWLSWRVAAERALYGEGGFYRREGAAARSFRTSVRVSERFAAALTGLLCEVDEALGHPPELDLVDVGAGDGLLLAGMLRHAPADLRARLRAVAVEVGPRPAGLDGAIGWERELPGSVTGLVLANEWLDNVPVDVVELTDDGPRTVLVHPGSGQERLGDRPPEKDRDWLDEWWPLAEAGDRAEVGWPRDEAWAGLTRRLARGLAVAIDYGHVKGDRPPGGSLTGYRDGRQVVPVPDGSCDLTAHVALDACAARTGSRLTTQRAALRALGVLGARPPIEEASRDPRRYARRLREAGEEGELIDPAGLGSFGWLLHAVGAATTIEP